MTNVAVAELHRFEPREVAIDTTVLILPGGGFRILAWDHEGTRLAAWLNERGVPAAVLKYRVPTADLDPPWRLPMGDAAWAAETIRSSHPDRTLGIIGFSAGGQATLRTLIAHGDDFDYAGLVYPAYVLNDDDGYRDGIAVDGSFPPTFLAHAIDDPYPSLACERLHRSLRERGVASELHLYAAGGHGFGMFDTGTPADGWRDAWGRFVRHAGAADD